jgi:transcriptional regulator with XRE-family HTH domain
MNFSGTLRALRTASRLSLKELEGQSGVTEHAILNIEKGRHMPANGTLERLSGPLATSVVMFIVMASTDDEMFDIPPEIRAKLREIALAKITVGQHGSH